MDMFTLTTKIMAIERIAERQQGALFNARSGERIRAHMAWLRNLIATGAERADIYRQVTLLRTDEDWPGDLKGWAFYDDRLDALAQYLAEPEVFPTQAELVDELERAIEAGVIR